MIADTCIAALIYCPNLITKFNNQIKRMVKTLYLLSTFLTKVDVNFYHQQLLIALT